MSEHPAIIRLKDQIAFAMIVKRARMEIYNVIHVKFSNYVAQAFRQSLTPIQQANLLNTTDFYRDTEVYKEYEEELKKAVVEALYKEVCLNER